ncbi:amino acid ABC transporter permease [Pandoraea nosoerga]|uniref:Polar amino acid ABC transporter permease n=1 Tax=Pandoraea nosoerga TaxID=2508296 RepID=A0A5E4RK85_9BURK|nr:MULTISPECIES: amino acid ABC transporter permease [Pandoraea]MBN4664502.1 amino acid ABC transporter permease [Pandoraea nosoerga]MBN4674462.1 amino acid ABC transporter permease [Pandoraea nosoerga]MBN4679730.1 amino acid ABC transporter permease [Pandoraea nosoerga]MBN4743182.1 amino acid ABC transporter permease [Pandoraea nosoerga]VVD63726.1 polar amino acid ABC transporter permease [Pandoraea nosoerga]
MSESPRKAAGAGIGAAGRERRLNIGGMPSSPFTLLLVALIGALVAIAGSAYTIVALREGLVANQLDGWWVPVGAVLLGLVSLIVLMPLVRAFARWRAFRRAAARRDVVAARVARAEADVQSWIALGYTLAQVIVVLALQFVLANHLAVAKTFFFLPLIVKTFPLVLDAFWVNVKIFIIAEVFVLIWGLVVALAMFAPGQAGKPLRFIATAYVDIFRAMPAVLVIYLVGFGLPLTGVPILKDLSLTTYVVIALTLTVGAYVAEIYRAGIQGVHWSQVAAARSLGLSYTQTLRFVVLPQGIRQIIPPLLNAFIALQKDTALVNVVGVIDSFNQSMVIASNHYNLSAATTVAVLFIIISIPQVRFVERMAQRDRARMRAGGA